MSIGCKIIRDFERPSAELISRFRNLPVANIDDCMGRIAAVDSAIEPVGNKGQLLGPAFTVRVPQGGQSDAPCGDGSGKAGRCDPD